MTSAAIPCYWDGEAFVPRHGFVAQCARVFEQGKTYPLSIHEDRSTVSHRHYFAAVSEGWANLPENLAKEFPTPEHLRKHALIKAGYADKTSFICGSRDEAVRLCAWLKPIDPYALVTVNECVITRWTAQSQNTKAMGKRMFQHSKDSVLGIIADMIGVKPEALSRERAA